MRLIVTGGAGFIGSNLVCRLVREGHSVRTIDNLSYAGSLANLTPVAQAPGHEFLRMDVADEAAVRAAFVEFAPDAALHLAAESHVDRSVDSPRQFIDTNIIGTFAVLEAALAVARSNPDFRLLHVSTDEVFGSLGSSGRFDETSPYQPNSPYSASKAAADHLARAWQRTYDLPVIVTNCSNNYGPYQHPEKFIPTVIRKALHGEAIPVYGDGQQVRDWLHVQDHIDGLWLALTAGTPGATYNIGADNERANLAVVEQVLDAVAVHAGIDRQALAALVAFVTDRPGHDRRYAVDAAASGNSSAGPPPRPSMKALQTPYAGTSTTNPGAAKSRPGPMGSGSGCRAGGRGRAPDAQGHRTGWRPRHPALSGDSRSL